MDEYSGIVNIGDFICCIKGNGDGLVLNMENVKEMNGNRYLKCYKNKICFLFWLQVVKNVEKYQCQDMYYFIYGMCVFFGGYFINSFFV